MFVVMIDVNASTNFTPYKLYPVTSGEVKNDRETQFLPEVLRPDMFIIMDIN